MNQVGDRIKILRKDKGLTQTQLAALVGVDGSMITKLEKGHTSGSLQTLHAVATALGVSVADLLGESGELPKVG